MICHFKDGEGITHELLIQSEKTVKDLKKTIENVMINYEIKKKSMASISDSEINSIQSKIEKDHSSQMNKDIDNRNDSFQEKNKKASKDGENEEENKLDDINENILTLNKSDFNDSLLSKEKVQISIFKYRWDLFMIKFKVYTLYNEQKLSDLDISEGDLFIIQPLETVNIFYMLPINSKKYFDVIFKPQFLGNINNAQNDNNNNEIKNDDTNNINNIYDDTNNTKVGFKWNQKVGWLIGPIAIPFSTNCAITLLNALETVFCAKRTNIKIFDSSWSEIRILSSMTPILKNNLVFGLYIRNQAEELRNFPNKNLTAWTTVFKYKYCNLPTRAKCKQILHSQSNSKLQVLIAQPIPQEIPKDQNILKMDVNGKNKIDSTNDSIPLAKAKSGPLKGSQIPLKKTKSIILNQNNESILASNQNLSNLSCKNSGSIHFYHPVPVFFSYGNNKLVLACFDSDKNIEVQLSEIKKDLGIPESAKISVEFNGKIINTEKNPEELKIIEFSTLRIIFPGSCILI